MAAIIELVHVATVDMLKGILPGTAKLETTHFEKQRKGENKTSISFSKKLAVV